MNKSIEDQIEIDEQYNPAQKYQITKNKKKKIKNLNEMQCNSNKWTLKENQRFLEFIKANRQLLECQRRRKQQKVFLQLSREIKSRSADQCRSHHQKMIKHHQDLDGIIRHLQNRLSLNNSSEKGTQKNSQVEGNKIQKLDKILNLSIETQCQLGLQLQISVEEPEQIPQQQKDIWQLIDQQAWTSGPLLFTNLNY